MKRLVLLSMVLAASACGGDDDDEHTHDDAAPADAGADAPVDAALEATHNGTITVLQAELFNSSYDLYGNGTQVGVSFTDNSMTLAPTAEEQPGQLTGCKAWVYDLKNPDHVAALAADDGVDQGTVEVTVEDGSPEFPLCGFSTAAEEYLCADGTSSGGGGTFATTFGGNPAPTGTSYFTATGEATFQASDVGRYVSFRAVTTPSATLNTLVPIVGRVSDTTIVLGTGVPIAGDLNTGAMYTTLAGIGPIPLTTSHASSLADADEVTVELTASTGAVFESFTRTFTGIGDSFELGTKADKVLLNDIPTTGAEFTIGCDSEKACGAADGSLLSITTTDANVAGLSPYAFPDATETFVELRCAQFGEETLTVPAEFSEYLMKSGATRIKAQFIRGKFQLVENEDGAPNTTTVIAGHVAVGFTDVAD